MIIKLKVIKPLWYYKQLCMIILKFRELVKSFLQVMKDTGGFYLKDHISKLIEKLLQLSVEYRDNLLIIAIIAIIS